LKNVDSII